MQKFHELSYTRPDPAKLKKEYLGFVRALKNAGDFAAADAAFLGMQGVLDRATTQFQIASIRNTMNMKDAFYDAEIAFFNREIPKLMLVVKKGNKAALESPFRKQLAEKYGAHLFKELEVRQRLMSLWIVLPSIRENKLSTEYSKTAAACSVEFRGESCNFYGLLRHMQSTDRDERRDAFRAWAGLYESVAPKLEKQYGKLVKDRCTIAKKLGFRSYIDYIYLSRGRYDYDAEKIAAFREAVRTNITPLAERLFKAQAARLGVEKLCWYDEDLIFPEGNAVPIGTPEELTEQARQMYEALSPETGAFFNFMTEHELFDFVTRENKHLGGYCTFLPQYKAPFIFSNFNGTSADVDVLTHEAGHAFEAYLASHRLPFSSQVFSTSEVNEIHSMSMELFAHPYMERFFGDKAPKYRFAHLCDALQTIPYLVSIDEFQHRVFAQPDSGPADWRRFWKETEEKYMPWRSYDGNEFLESGGFWMQKQHVFLYPFYYVDYALAQLCAFSLYQKTVEGDDAWSDYVELCSMGGKYGYFETLERAGIPNPLDPENVRETTAFVERRIEALKAEL